MADFLYDVGTNGSILGSPLSLMGAADLNALGSGSAVTSSASALSQTSFGSGLMGYVYFTVVTTAFTPAVAGAALVGWWAFSGDGGSNFETVIATPSTTVPALSRPPDFTIAFDNGVSHTAGIIRPSQLIQLPAYSTKAIIQNNLGVALSAANHTLKCFPVAVVRA